MKTLKKFLFCLVLLSAGASTSFAGTAPQLGVGYGREFRENTRLEQYEVFWRQPLSYTTTIGGSWNLSTDLEFAGALLRESGSNSDKTGRFSIMPQLILSPNEMVNFIIGLGTGFMVGTLNYGDNNLGGDFLFNSKVGIQLVLAERWGLEYVFYHQSNAGIYDQNDGLNMNQISLTYHF